MLTQYLTRIFFCVGMITGIIFYGTALAEETQTDSLREAISGLQAQVRALEMQMLDMKLAASRESSTQPLLFDDNMIAGRGGAVYLPRRETAPAPVSESVADVNTSSVASALAASGLEITGFLDGIYAYDPDHKTNSRAAINQVEVDLARELNERAGVALSLWYDESFVVGAATISYALRDIESEENKPVPLISNWTITAGQFDMPFGLDYFRYTSIARPTITMPDAVMATHNGWNDIGLMSSWSFRYGSLDFYGVKGFENRVWNSDEEIPGDVADDDERWQTVQPQISGGTRLHLNIIPKVECGLSLARGWSSGRDPVMSLAGVHAQTGYRGFSVMGEMLYSRKAETVKPLTARGFYLEAMQSIGKLYAIARHDYVDEESAEILRYYSFGAGVRIAENLFCRTEFRTNESGADRRLYLQVAAGF
ncbi:hypothetical protein EHM69_07600 [candidate division KSB1 bacterium]|nr:MAG: hypothetical protein EHM69_07600 [candidate division KSB1 bacterium]